MHIRKALEGDLPRIMEIYAVARRFMAAQGNPRQWGATNWPPEELIREDIRRGACHVCQKEDRVVAVFFFAPGPDPTYRVIHEGSWAADTPYGVVHRIASDGTAKGAGSFCIHWAYEQCGHLRMDTHPDNAPMLHLLPALGFTRRGIIYVEEDDEPRIAFEKI